MDSLVRTARMTGLLYVGVAISGLLGFVLIRPRLFNADNPAATLANLTGHESLARAGVAVELLLVLTQALVALWFFRLFRAADPFAAGAIAVFGMANAASILVSAALLATALDVALTPVGDPAIAAQLLYLVSGNLWGVTNLFFGLWLIPMGWCALRTGMPRPLGWILIGGGVGYVLSAFVMYLAPTASALTDALPWLATVGEFWMIGYLLVRGVGRRALTPSPAEAGVR
jgi:hypothetical protein